MRQHDLFCVFEDDDILIMISGQQFNKELLNKSIITQKWPSQSNTIYYVGLYKQSQTGLLYNERVLILQDKTFTVFYTKYFKPLHILNEWQKKGTITTKDRPSIKDTTVTLQQNNINIEYRNGRRQKKTWVFKFFSNELAMKWLCLFYQLQQKYSNIYYKTKKTKSTEIESELVYNEGTKKHSQTIKKQIKEEEVQQQQDNHKQVKYIFY